MKLVIATDFFSPWAGGPATFIENFTAYLRHTAHRVEIVAPSVDGLPRREHRGGLVIHRVPTLPFPFGFDLRVTHRLDAVRHVLKAAQPDVLQVHHPFPLSMGAVRAARALHVPVVAVNHTIPECLFYGLRRTPVVYPAALGAFRAYLRFFLSQADAVCTPTQTAADLLHAAGFAGEVAVISNGIDTQRFTPAHDKQALKRRFGFAGKPIVAYVGRLDPEKDLRTWLHAAALLRRTMDVHFVLGGTGTERAALERLAADLQLTEHLTFTGFVAAEDLPALYGAADLYCITGTVELQSISTLEAMAAGLPIVAANAAALPELVYSGVNGYLAEAGDAASFAEGMRRVLCDAHSAAAMSRGSRLIAEKHALGTTAHQHLRLLERVAHSSASYAGTHPA